MNQQTEREHLEDVLHAYLAAASNPDYATLNEWVRRYPYYAQELTEFTVARNLMHALPEAAVTEQDEAALITFGQGVIASHLGAAQSNQSAATPVTSLIAAGTALGLKLPDIARQMHLSPVIVRKLDRRLFQFTSLPNAIIEQLGRVLKQETSAIVTYLQQSPTLAAGASYRSEDAPRLAAAEDFAEAIKSDISLSQEDCEYWLQQASKQ